MASAPEVCSSIELASANFGETFGLALSNMLGLGGVFVDLGAETELDKLRKQVNTISTQIQEFNNKATQQFAKSQSAFDDQIINSISTMQTNNNTLLKYNTELLRDDITSNTTYISSIFFLTIIILLYMLTLPID
jgi:predicted PurR-regulated permease PerM